MQKGDKFDTERKIRDAANLRTRQRLFIPICLKQEAKLIPSAKYGILLA